MEKVKTKRKEKLKLGSILVPKQPTTHKRRVRAILGNIIAVSEETEFEEPTFITYRQLEPIYWYDLEELLKFFEVENNANNKTKIK